MYDVGKILQVGGNGFKNEEPYYPSSRAATIIDIDSDPPLVYDTDSMTYPGNGHRPLCYRTAECL